MKSEEFLKAGLDRKGKGMQDKLWWNMAISFTFLGQHWYKGADKLIIIVGSSLIIDLNTWR